MFVGKSKSKKESVERKECSNVENTGYHLAMKGNRPHNVTYI